jgi:putative glutamine amidotransferase
MRKPIIGVTPLWDSKKASIWMLPGYIDSIIDAGGIPVILPFSARESVLKTACEICDGFLFTGGQDVSPLIYSEDISSLCGEISDARDSQEAFIYKTEIVEKKKPLLGICRGIQIINALAGGSLHQHLDEKNGVFHSVNATKTVHEVTIEKSTFLSEIFVEKTFPVVSSHHQGIKKLATGAVAAAYAPDGLIEAIVLKDHPFAVGLQWHPEMKTDDIYSKKIFGAFVECAKNEINYTKGK